MTLRGVYVPADEGAPLVVCFQATGRSVAPPKNVDVSISIAPLTRHLQGLGLSTLVFDYRGVGISSGRRDSHRLQDEARVIWSEAMSLVGDRPERIVLRGTSLGSLAVASLLNDGIEPGGVVLISPIRGETVARNAGIAKFDKALVRLASRFLRNVAKVDIVDALAQAKTRFVVVASPHDAFLPLDEQAMLKQAIEGKGAWVDSHRALGRDADPFSAHVIVAGLNERIPDPNEVALYRELFAIDQAATRKLPAFQKAIPDTEREVATGPALTKRLEQVAVRFHSNTAPLAAALASEARPHAMEEYTAWLYNLPSTVVEDISFDAARYLVRLDDRFGELSLDQLTDLSILFSVYKRGLSVTEVLEIFSRYTGSGSPELPRVTGSAADKSLHDRLLDIRRTLKAELGLSSIDRSRIFLRLLAKANGIPDRPLSGQTAAIDLWIQGAWMRVGFAEQE